MQTARETTTTAPKQRARSSTRRPFADESGIFIVLVLLALQAALGLVFDPRYRDFPFAPLTAAVVPFLVLMIAVPRPGGPRAIAETVAGVALIASAGYIAINESFANWQAAWFCAGVAGLAVILLRARDVPDSK